MKKLILILILTGCENSGTNKDVTCYSMGQVIYSGQAEGAVESTGNGYLITELGTGKIVRLTGDCVIKNQ